MPLPKFIAGHSIQLHSSSKILLLPEIFLPTGVTESQSKISRFLLSECTHKHVYSLSFFFLKFVFFNLLRLNSKIWTFLLFTRSAAGLHMLTILKNCTTVSHTYTHTHSAEICFVIFFVELRTESVWVYADCWPKFKPETLLPIVQFDLRRWGQLRQSSSR